MFVIVDMPDGRKRIFEKFRRHEIELKRHDVKGCAPFFVASCHRNYTDFNELKKLISRYGVALVGQDEMLRNEMSSVLFEPTVLPLKMLVKTVGEYFGREKENQSKTVTVFDDNARACDVISFLARNVRYVRVVTSRFDRYEIAAAEVFASYGISIEISDNLATAYGSDVIITLSDEPFKDFDCGKVICYKKHTQNPNFFALNQTNLSYDRFDCERYGIDNFTFVCALYETCGYYLKKIPVFTELNGVL